MMKKTFSLTNLYLSLLCAGASVWAHNLFFGAEVAIGDISGFVILLQSFLFFALVSALGKKYLLGVNAVISVFVILLQIYHRLHPEPLMLSTIFSQYAEGTEYLFRAGLDWLDVKILSYFAYFAVVEFLIYKFYDKDYDKKYNLAVFFTPLAIFYGIAFYDCNNQNFDKSYFSDKVKIFGYPQGWIYEITTLSGEKTQLADVVRKAQEKPLPLPEELQNIKPHKHIYVIQLESFHYDAFQKEVNGKKIMPNLNALAQKAATYKIFSRIPNYSANSDFAAMHGVYDILDYPYVIYEIASPQELYEKITPIPLLYQRKGYYLDFYHGFTGGFYNRFPFITAEGFDDVFFYEDLKGKLPEHEEEWGVSDLDTAKFIVARQKANSKTKSFTFFITVTTHDPYKIGQRHQTIFPAPKNLLERYYNGAEYMDEVIKTLVSQAPQDSLFILYSDHPTVTELSSETFLMLYSNKQNLSHQGKISFSQALQIIKSVLYQNLQ